MSLPWRPTGWRRATDYRGAHILAGQEKGKPITVRVFLKGADRACWTGRGYADAAEAMAAAKKIVDARKGN
jgi:hypothetical protein